MSRSLRMLRHAATGISTAMLFTAALAGCPEDDTPAAADASAPLPSTTPSSSSTTPPSGSDAAPPDAAVPTLAPTHTGLVSIQDITLANVPAAGHGLTATTILNRVVAPEYEEIPGSVEGCRVYTYDVDTKPQPPEEDHGVLRIGGAKGGNLECRFVPQRGYVCPTATGAGTFTVEPPAGGASTAAYTVPGAAFSANDVGRYLQIAGTGAAGNLGAFAIVAAPSATQVVVANPRAVAESFPGNFTVIAGAGPTPNDLYRPFEGVSAIELDLPEKVTFASPKATLRPGDAFTLDETSARTLVAIPLDGAATTLRCSSCGTADGTIVRIQTTDASIAGLSPVAFPAPKKKSVEIQCVRVGTGEITVPAAAMEFLKKSHLASPVTRIRTAFMRDGLRVHTAAAPLPANRIALAVGRGTIGFTNP